MPFTPTFTLTPKIQRQIKAIENTTGFLEAVRLRDDWIRQVRDRTRVQEALDSVQIEGNSLTFKQAFELADSLPDRELVDSEREFCNYLAAFQMIDSLRGERSEVLRRGDLLNIHRALVAGVRGGDRFSGQLRREGVKVGDRQGSQTVVHHAPPSWTEVEDLVDSLFTWIEDTKRRGKGTDDPWIHPVIQAGIAHHRLVWIHPFVDGNGRTARMMTTVLLYQRGYDFKYLFQLSGYYNSDRDAYYRALRTADATNDYTEWLTYFLGGFSMQMVAIKKRAAAAGAGGET